MSLKQITLDELKAHNTARELWLAIHDKVYDVTKFIDLHPGGTHTMMRVVGGYATEEFLESPHGTEAYDIMTDLLIGELVEADKEKKKFIKKEKKEKVEKVEKKQQLQSEKPDLEPSYITPVILVALVAFIIWMVYK